MTQTEYDQQKRECWEEAVLHGALEVDKDLLFDHAFKCGYSLGKQEKDAVTNEEIEKLSFEFAEDKKWHNFNDLRSRARLLRQFITYIEKHK